MRALLVGVALVAACSGKTTPAGPLGETHDLRHLLPEAVRGQAPAETAVKQHRQEVGIGTSDPMPVVAVKWGAFSGEDGAYLTSISFEVVKPLEGVSLAAAPFGNPTNRGTAERPIQSHHWRITWSKQESGGTKSGTVSGSVVADGTFNVH